MNGLSGIILATSLCANVVYAADPEPTDTRTAAGVAITTEEAYTMTVDSNSWKGWPEGPQTYGEANIIMDAETGAILYAKNIDGKSYPASITKVLTMLIALENGNLTDTVSFSADSIYSVPYSYAHIGMKEGEEISLEDALYGMMLASANEVAYSIGESVGQNLGEDYNWFIEKMNERCQELGGLNSNFVNTNGLDDENHYTTARDMALITQELLKYPEFETISQTLQYTIPPTNITDELRTFQQVHKMFYSANEHYDERVIAGKTGYTDIALNTLITCADDGNMKLICVNLKTHGTNVYPDTENLFNYAFDSFEHIDVSTVEKSTDIANYGENSYVTVPVGVSFDDLEMTLLEDEENNMIGTAIYTYQGTCVGNVDVEFSQSYIDEHHSENKSEEENNDKKEVSPILKYIKYGIFTILAVIAILFVTIVLLIIRKKKIQRERRRRRQAAMRRRNQARQRNNGNGRRRRKGE